MHRSSHFSIEETFTESGYTYPTFLYAMFPFPTLAKKINDYRWDTSVLDKN